MANFQTAEMAVLLSKLRRGRLDRSHLTADDAVGLGGAFVDLVAASDEEFAKVLAASRTPMLGVLKVASSRDASSQDPW